MCARCEIIITGNWVSYEVQLCVKNGSCHEGWEFFNGLKGYQVTKAVHDKSLTKNKRLKYEPTYPKGYTASHTGERWITFRSINACKLMTLGLISASALRHGNQRKQP